MHEPPDVADRELLGSVREHWLPGADGVEHLPVGFGAHHWAVSAAGRRLLFLTLDRLGTRHTAATLEGAYAGAADLAAQGLEFVLAPLRSGTGTFTVRLGDGAVSATPWRDGVSGDGPHPDTADAAASARRLSRLHAAAAAAQVPRWAPLVPLSLGDDVVALAARRWDDGPHGEAARAAVVAALADIATWTTRYHRLAQVARQRPWVPTHGEPHTRNLLRTAHGDVLVDWESLKVAPRERDLATLLAGPTGSLRGYRWPAGRSGPDPRMVELFDLEWRLDEIDQYTDLFAARHADDADTRTSLDGLRHELTRPPRPAPAEPG